jgi:hypothetical protein
MLRPVRKTKPVLTDTPSRPRNAAVIAQRAALKATEDRAASVRMAELLMSVEGCTGPGCDGGHQAHLEAGRNALRLLGLMHDPEPSGKGNYHWGAK